MIPYFQFTAFYIGPVRMYVWGLMVALGILLGTWIALREAKKRGLDVAQFERAAFWIILWSFVGARAGHVIFYEWHYYSSNLVEIFKIWHGGLSSYGGFIGGILAGLWTLRRERGRLWSYADCAAYGGAAGWTIGRIGCFLIHDHPGTLTDFVLAVKQPDGTARHDLGLYDGLLSAGIFLLFLLLSRRKLPTRACALLFMILYGGGRFFLDFLRARDLPGSDARYFNLTPAQYLSVVMVLVGVYFLLPFLTKFKVHSSASS